MVDDNSDESYLAEVLATAEDSSNSVFCETFSFTDSKGFTTKVTLCDSDQTLSGPLSVLVSKYQYKQNYESGFAAIHTTGVFPGRGYDYDAGREITHAAVLPLDKFLSFFKDPKKLGGIFLNEAETLVRKWLASYKDETTVGKRCCVARNYSLTPNAYLSSKGRPSKSTYKLQITSYAHNLANQNEARPRLTWRDLKVYIKLKSSPTTAPRSNSWSKCEDGLTYDKFGYSATLPHFLELLEDKGFAQFVAASSLSRPVRHRQDPDAEEEPEKRRKTGEAPEEEGGGT